MTAGETLGPQFRQLTASVEQLTRGFQGLVPATNDAIGALKGFAAAAAPGGLKPLSQAFDLMAATVGVTVAPAFVLVAAAVSAAAVTISEELEPNLDKVAQWYADHVDDFVSFGEAVVSATRAVLEFGKFLAGKYEPGEGHIERGDFAGPAALLAHWDKLRFEKKFGEELDRRIAEGNANRAAGFPNGRPAQVPMRNEFDQQAFEQQWALAEAGGGAGGKAKPSFRDVMSQMFGTIVAGMKQDMGGAPGFGRIEDAWRKNQMAAFENPMQSMIRQQWEKTIKLLENIGMKIADGNRAPNVVVGGAGAPGA